MTGDADLDTTVVEPEDAPPAEDASPRRRKVSRWDRPPEPHDWRWVVGHIGRSMITIGLLMFGFVAYQLWGTGIQTARAQSHLDQEFDQFIEDQGITVDTLGPATTTTIGVSPVSEPSTTSTLPPQPVEQDYGDVDPGDGLARLKIPEIGVDYIVVAGVSTKDLRDGPGHFPNTPLPGQYGNSAIAGHRTTYGAPFYDLDHLKPGDEIQVFTKLGGAYVYIVTGSEVVSPTDYHVITDSDPTKATITLVTCTPLRTAKERLVVHGTLDQSRSNEIGKPLINYGQSTPIPTDSVLPGDDTEAPTAVSAAAAPAVTTEPVATTVDTAPVTATTQPDNRSATTDAFSQGWFGDRAAWPHVVFWCALLALVWYGSYRLAKRFRRLWLGLAVGFVPFVIVLYFFYENVNRLLPPAL